MNLAPMRFKNYIWPHNPRVYEIDYHRDVVSHKVPFGMYALQNTGRTNRVLRGEGEFAGAGAYNDFRRLATVFCEDSPGVLVHPVWQSSMAYFVGLSLRQEPTEDFVSYAFEFWECYDGYNTRLTAVSAGSSGGGSAWEAGAAEKAESECRWYTVAAGDCLWNIAAKNGMNLDELLALNPQIKNPNLIYAGNRVRLS